MQPKTKRRFIIRRIGSNPQQYYQTKGQGKIRKKKVVDDVTIDRIIGFWSTSQAKASKFTDNKRTLPEGCEFVERIKGPPPAVETLHDWR